VISTKLRRRAALTLLTVAALFSTAATALADPVIERVESKVSRNRRLTVVIEATFSGRGELRIEGDVNGKRVRKRKRVRRAGTKRLRVKIDAKQLRLRKLTEALVFDVKAVAEERDGGMVERPVQTTIPVPVVLLGGFGNELAPGGTSVFGVALNAATGGTYDLGTERPTMIAHDYASLDASLSELARELNKTVRAALRGTSFARVDVVGYSMGGLVARRWLADQGAGKVRRMVFLATPNEGAPLVQVIGLGLDSDLLGGALAGVIPGLGEASGLGDILDGVLDGTISPDTLRIFYPTYEWAFVTINVPFLGEQRIALTSNLLGTFGAFLPPELAGLDFNLDSPLTPLNAVGPDSRAAYFALGYSSLPTELLGVEIGTLDEVDFGALITGGDEFDPLSLATGEGDGLVPWRSLVMADTPGWSEAITATDLGVGTHVTILADPACITRVAEILSE
jgi:pimeloyl-ACP methyl ester carboxylesterase